MPLEGNRNATEQHHGVTFCDDARRVAVEWTNAGIALSGHRNAVHERATGSGDHLAAMTGRVTKSNHSFHERPPQLNKKAGRVSGRIAALYRSASQRQTVSPYADPSLAMGSPAR